MKMTVKSPPTLPIPRLCQHISQLSPQRREENQILRPGAPVRGFVLWVLRGLELRRAAPLTRDGGRRFHVVPEPAAGPGGDVKLVCLVEVGGALGEGDVERGLAGQRPGGDGGVDEVAAPGGGVAGHEEGDCGV